MSRGGPPTACVVWMTDDNPAELEIAEEAVRETGFIGRFVTFTGGATTLAALADLGERPAEMPDVLILDVKMPGLGGIEVLQRLKADTRLAAIPVVMFTTSAQGQDRDRCLRLGAADYVVKPVGFTEFLTLFEDLVRTWC